MGILSTLLAGVIAGMAMPPERHAAQPHPWLGGCRAQHPSTPTTQESLLGQLTFQLNSPRRRKLQVSRLLNGARGAASQLGRARTPQGCPPPRWGGQAAALGNAAAHRGVSSPRAVWTSVQALPGHNDGGTSITCTQWTDLARFDECGGGIGPPGPISTPHYTATTAQAHRDGQSRGSDTGAI